MGGSRILSSCSEKVRQAPAEKQAQNDCADPRGGKDGRLIHHICGVRGEKERGEQEKSEREYRGVSARSSEAHGPLARRSQVEAGRFMRAGAQTVPTEFAVVSLTGIHGVTENRAAGDLVRALVASVGGARRCAETAVCGNGKWGCWGQHHGQAGQGGKRDDTTLRARRACTAPPTTE